jgi:hypothetical protein
MVRPRGAKQAATGLLSLPGPPWPSLSHTVIRACAVEHNGYSLQRTIHGTQYYSKTEDDNNCTPVERRSPRLCPLQQQQRQQAAEYFFVLLFWLPRKPRALYAQGRRLYIHGALVLRPPGHYVARSLAVLVIPPLDHLFPTSLSHGTSRN